MIKKHFLRDAVYPLFKTESLRKKVCNLAEDLYSLEDDQQHHVPVPISNRLIAQYSSSVVFPRLRVRTFSQDPYHIQSSFFDHSRRWLKSHSISRDIRVLFHSPPFPQPFSHDLFNNSKDRPPQSTSNCAKATERSLSLPILPFGVSQPT